MTPRIEASSTFPALRLVTDVAPDVHPLTTPTAPLLPSRETAGGSADIWEEVDRAAAWVHDEVVAGRLHVVGLPAGGHSDGTPAPGELARQTLRLLCVAARAAFTSQGLAGAPLVLRREDIPGGLSPAALLRALRARLTEQTVAARDGGLPAADPSDVLRALLALERVEAAFAGDGVRTAMEQLTGATAMELLVEVAHDMRSPLGSILFLVERLRHTAAAGATRPAEEDRQLALVYGAAFGLSSMVSDVMELARGGDRLAAGEPGPIVVAETVQAVTAIVAPLAEEKGLSLLVDEVPRDVRIGHGAALHRVLVNLVTNALKFTPSGSVAVHVEALSRDRLAFTVRDTGRGIPARVLAELFQTFRRRASGAARDYAFSSAGLGLAICQKLLGAMGSELRVDSTEGVGTTFSFELELPPAPADAARATLGR
jgi:signal transduction histidine kinase